VVAGARDGVSEAGLTGVVGAEGSTGELRAVVPP
jgi:hypothetical protein